MTDLALIVLTALIVLGIVTGAASACPRCGANPLAWSRWTHTGSRCPTCNQPTHGP